MTFAFLKTANKNFFVAFIGVRMRLLATESFFFFSPCRGAENTHHGKSYDARQRDEKCTSGYVFSSKSSSHNDTLSIMFPEQHKLLHSTVTLDYNSFDVKMQQKEPDW